jgi:Protein of unknown function (DUF732)
MRDRETIDAELRRIALGRRSVSEQGRQPSSREVDELLDELLAHSRGAAFTTPVNASETEAVADTPLPGKKTRTTLRRRKDALRRAGLFAALPLSLVAVVAAAVAAMSGVHHQDPAAQPTETPPSAAPPQSDATKVPAARIAMADTAFVAALKQQGVPIPSQEYVTNQGHAVCDFLSRQPNFADAVGFVQRSSIWNADQSANVTAGAIVSYCPQSQPTLTAETQPAYQNALSDLEAIQRRLQSIQGDLQGIQGNLDGLPGRR